MGSRSAHLVVKPRIVASLCCRPSILALPSMEKDREMISAEAGSEDGAGVVMPTSNKLEFREA